MDVDVGLLLDGGKTNTAQMVVAGAVRVGQDSTQRTNAATKGKRRKQYIIELLSIGLTRGA